MKLGKLFIGIFLIISFFSFAEIKTWSAQGLKGNWSNPENWQPAGIPSEKDSVIFNQTSNADCIIDTPVNVESITVESDKFSGVVIQKKSVKVKKGFYLKGTKGKGRWNTNGNLIQTDGDWINEIKTRFGYFGSTVKMTGSGVLKGLYFDILKCAYDKKVINLQSYIYITGKKHTLYLGSGKITGNTRITFYREGKVLVLEGEKPPVLQLKVGFQFRPSTEKTTYVPGLDYFSNLHITGVMSDTYLVLDGNVKCKNMVVSSMTKEKTTTLTTNNHDIEISGDLILGQKDSYGVLKCGKSHIKISGNLIIANEGSSLWAEDSTIEIGGKIINKGSLIKGNAKIITDNENKK